MEPSSAPRSTSESQPPIPADPALFLDFDGTLVEIAGRPDAVRVPGEVMRILRHLAADPHAAVALVTGRPIAQLDDFLGDLRLPAAGLHGLEWRRDAGEGAVHVPPSASMLRLKAALDHENFSSGVMIEDKGSTVAVHYRAVPAAEPRVREIVGRLVAKTDDLVALPGKMVVEVKPAGISKGLAIRRFMAEPPFAGRVPVVLGDDVTDEAGFEEAARLGGFGVKVGEGATSAAYRLPSVAAVHRWLAALADGPAGSTRSGSLSAPAPH